MMKTKPGIKNKDQRGLPEILSCGGHFRQRSTKTVVIKHHAKTIRNETYIWNGSLA